MQKKLLLIYLIVLTGFIGLIWYLNLDFSMVFEIKNPVFFLLAFPLFLLSFPFFALRVKSILKGINENVSLINLIKLEFINRFVLNITPSKLNVPIKAVLLHKVFGVEKKNAVSSISLEFFMDVGIQLFFSIIGIYLFFASLAYISLESLLLIGLLALGTSVVFFLIPIRFFDSLISFSDKISHSFIKRMSKFCFDTMKHIRTTWISILFGKQFVPIVFSIALIVLFQALSIEAVFFSYDYYLPLVYIIVINSVALIVSAVAPVPAGFGVREGTLILLFVFLGVPEEIAVAVAILSRIVALFPVLLGYYFASSMGVEKFFELKSFKII